MKKLHLMQQMNYNKSSHTLQDFSFYKSAIHFSYTNELSFIHKQTDMRNSLFKTPELYI